MCTNSRKPRTVLKRLVATSSFLAFAGAVGLGQAAPASAAPASAQALAPCSLCTVRVSDAARSEARSSALDLGFMIFRVRLNVPAPVDTYIRYTTVNGAGPTGAVAGADYRFTSKWAKIAKGTTSARVPVRIHNDTKWEFTERFRVVLTAATGGATIVDGSGTGRIYDDDRPRFTALNATPVVEGNNPLSFEVRLSRRLATTVWVRYSTADGSAEAGQDYHARSGWLRFLPGTVSRHVVVPVIDDSLAGEGTERMRLLLSNPTGGATIADGLALGTIVDDDVIV